MSSSRRQQPMKLHAAWLAVAALALLSPPRPELHESTSGSTLQSVSAERPVLAMPAAHLERLSSVVKVAPRPMALPTQLAFETVSEVKRDPRPVERACGAV